MMVLRKILLELLYWQFCWSLRLLFLFIWFIKIADLNNQALNQSQMQQRKMTEQMERIFTTLLTTVQCSKPRKDRPTTLIWKGQIFESRMRIMYMLIWIICMKISTRVKLNRHNLDCQLLSCFLYIHLAIINIFTLLMHATLYFHDLT